MPSAMDIYEFFLKAADLGEKTGTVKIERVQVRETFDPQTKKKEPKLTVRFVGKKKLLLLNKTQTAALIEICQTDDYDKWAGHFVTIGPAKSRSGKDTIEITAPAEMPPKRDPAAIIAELTNGK